MSDDEETYTIPLKDQRIFGAGIKRKRVAFVPASAPTSTQPPLPRSSGTDVAAKYLSIVLPETPSPSSSPALSAGRTTTDGTPRDTQSAPPAAPTVPASKPPHHAPEQICPACNQTVSSTAPNLHAASITHQISLPHSHPPSSLDRTRKGLHYLQSYGWDPDSRTGLGSRGEGIVAPIRAREKRDTAGLGLVEAMRKEGEGRARLEERVRERVEKGRKLGAREVREMEEGKKRRGERVMRMFREERDLERYLGPDAD
ncbi:hypothetical protein P152DRAFT_512651 [Eremomyces bilateralis CBS 781.70]|uniref:G-patch domain-containing protein n=1 Tax=Eremomyces bilateralis CBS 781.70 TaxID=1392243 RepID=A0A6G1G8R0_9PEZI|nr:uncharacterized protein P152DRAFT_512651 [Eremomyces bilateralis CBS 781.70]KAF1814249.1 hypothetical protein P152DRAFT_512651 [Eremomyces bilateralis CBS 781.70]